MADKRLIDANALDRNFFDSCIGDCRRCSLNSVEHGECGCGLIYLAHTIDAVEVVHGRWEYSFGSYSTPKCSCCGWRIPYSEDSDLDARNYCPNCGAKMDAKEVKADG